MSGCVQAVGDGALSTEARFSAADCALPLLPRRVVDLRGLRMVMTIVPSPMPAQRRRFEGRQKYDLRRARRAAARHHATSRQGVV